MEDDSHLPNAASGYFRPTEVAELATYKLAAILAHFAVPTECYTVNFFRKTCTYEYLYAATKVS